MSVNAEGLWIAAKGRPWIYRHDTAAPGFPLGAIFGLPEETGPSEPLAAISWRGGTLWITREGSNVLMPVPARKLRRPPQP